MSINGSEHLFTCRKVCMLSDKFAGLKIRNCDTITRSPLTVFKHLMPKGFNTGFSSKVHSISLIIITLCLSCVFSGSLVSLMRALFSLPFIHLIMSYSHFFALHAFHRPLCAFSVFPILFNFIGLHLSIRCKTRTYSITITFARVQ